MSNSARSTINHVGIYVLPDKFDEVVSWYLAAFAPLKYEKVMAFPGVAGLGANKNPEFWVMTRKDAPQGACHLAFNAEGILTCIVRFD
jgi:hypothetical protein